MKKLCPVCGSVFEKRSSRQIYCSVHCRKVHHKEVYYDRKRPVPQYTDGDKVLRSFYCGKCKKYVLITNEKDKRRKFCSPRCEKLYWKHSHKLKTKESKAV